MRLLLALLLLLSLAEPASSRRKPQKSSGGAKSKPLRSGHARLPADPASGWPAADPELLGAAASLGLLEPRRCDFASVDGAALTPKAFESGHLRQAPIVLTGLTESWPARRGGWEREALLSKHGEFEITHAQASDVAQFGPKEGGGRSVTSALRDWVASTMDSTDGVHSPLAFDRSAAKYGSHASLQLLVISRSFFSDRLRVIAASRTSCTSVSSQAVCRNFLELL